MDNFDQAKGIFKSEPAAALSSGHGISQAG
jgi:hypothetical protein